LRIVVIGYWVRTLSLPNTQQQQEFFMSSQSRHIALVAALISIIALVFGTAVTTTSRFEVLHASPDAPALDVYIGNTKLVTGLQYTKFSPRRYVLPAGSYNIRVYQAGSDPNASPILLQTNVTFETNKRYLFAIGGRMGGLQPFNFEEPAKPPAAQTLIRFINLDPSIPSIDVLNSADSSVLIDDTTFGAAKSAAPLNAGSYALTLRQHGTATIIANVPSTSYPGGTINTLIKFASPSGTALAQGVVIDPGVIVLQRKR
jgi:hypothetical protein